MILYEKGGVRITKTLFQYENREYQIKSINAIFVDKINPDRRLPIICIVSGVLTITVYGLGLLILGLGIIWWMSQKPLFILMLDTNSGRVKGISHQDYSIISEIRSALIAMKIGDFRLDQKSALLAKN